jgi:NNP family nitrate/nitrite transporter-like MFS transporter
MIFLFALSMGASSGIYTMLPLFLVTERGFDTGWANTILGISRIAGLFMTFIGGWLVDRVGEKRVISTTLIVAGASTLLLGVLTGAWLVVIIFLQAALIALYFPAGFSALSRITDPNIRSVTTSLATPPAFLLGNGVLPTFIGYMGQNYSFGLGIGTAGCIIIAGSILVIFLKLQENTGDGC